MDEIICEVHPKELVEVIYVTVRKFVTHYLPKNGRRIHIIGQYTVNDSVHFLDVTTQAWVCGFPFLLKLQAPNEAIGWVSGHTSNKNWEGIMFDANSITHVAWGASVDPCPSYFP